MYACVRVRVRVRVRVSHFCSLMYAYVRG